MKVFVRGQKRGPSQTSLTRTNLHSIRPFAKFRGCKNEHYIHYIQTENRTGTYKGNLDKMLPMKWPYMSYLLPNEVLESRGLSPNQGDGGWWLPTVSVDPGGVMVLVALPIDTTDPLVEGTGSLNLTSGFVSGRSEKNNKTFRTEESTEGDFSNSIQ